MASCIVLLVALCMQVAIALDLSIISHIHEIALPPRPRLILTDERLTQVKNYIATDAQAAKYYQNTILQGEWILTVPPFWVHRENNTNDLGGARQVLQRVYCLSLLYRLTANITWAERCVKELTNAVAWYDWCLPGDALVTGELNHALAVGIDWLDAYWSDGRMDVRTNIIQGWIKNGLASMREGYTPPFKPWANNGSKRISAPFVSAISLLFACS
jgi:hypothetical protein